MALFMDLVPAALRPKTLALMADNAKAAGNITKACQGSNGGDPEACSAAAGGAGPHMTAGLFGIKWFLMSLADGGMNDLAYDVPTLGNKSVIQIPQFTPDDGPRSDIFILRSRY